jgi:hypothetical protein
VANNDLLYRTHQKAQKQTICLQIFSFATAVSFLLSLIRACAKQVSSCLRGLWKYCIIRMPETIPLGLTFFEAMCRAIVSAFLVNMSFLGKVDSVVTPLTHRFLLLRGLFFLDGISPPLTRKVE